MMRIMNRRVFLKAAVTLSLLSGFSPVVAAGIKTGSKLDAQVEHDQHIRDYLAKMADFDRSHPGDVYLDPHHFMLLKSSLNRLKRLQSTVGHGNFYLLNFDEALNIAKHYVSVGRFTKPEIDFLEMIFYKDGTVYGFWGEKPLKRLTDRVQKGKAIKIPRSGNYLYKGRPLELYRKIKSEIGEKVILTSGIRSVIKQFMLFLNKAYRHDGNLSLASRSLAPPGYSFHGVGDFDVGQVGLAGANFTYSFTETEVYRALSRLGFVDIRYHKNNFLGVRFEPWHIKVQNRL